MMSEPAADRPPAPEERRHGDRHGDRRAEAGPTRRARKPSRWARCVGVAGRDLLLIVAWLGAIVFSVRHVSPIYSGQPKVAESLVKAVPIAKAALPPTPKDTSQLAQLLASSRFAKDREAFAADLVKTGRMNQAR